MPDSESNSSEVVFFLGAGASVKAGVPDTFGLVDKFVERIRPQEENLHAVEKILKVLGEWRREQGGNRVDIELLLETIERLEKRNQDVLLRFHRVTDYELSGYAEKRPLKDELKDFIRTAGIVKSSGIRYLEPLLGFIAQQRPLDIFSLNYDICLEQFCNAYKKQYVDGFDVGWNPKLFERQDVDIRLYKMHGSITWYSTDTSDYVKIPIKSDKAQTELITGEKAEALILYPMRKWEYAEPLLELLIELKKKLETAKFVIVVGYSFRDDHIRRIFWDAARKNRNLILILVDPNAHRVYNERLKYYQIPNSEHSFSSDFGNDGYDVPFPSELSGRTVCLPYKFEDILPLLRDPFVRGARNGLRVEREEKEKEILGATPAWSNVIGLFIDCNFMEKSDELLQSIDLQALFKTNFPLAIGWTVKCIINYAGLENYAKAKEWFENLSCFIIKRELNVTVDRGPTIIGAGFMISENSSAPFSSIAINIKETFDTVRRLKAITEEDRLRKVKYALDSLENLEKYLQLWNEVPNRGIEISRYITLRENDYPEEIKAFRKENSEYQAVYSQDRHNRLGAIVSAIEKKELEKILKIQTPN